MKAKILKRDLERIENDLAIERRYSERFQPFINELLKNKYDISGSAMIEVIRDIIYSGTLEKFLKNQALKKFTSINEMPITLEKKLEMIDVNSAYPNYTGILTLYNSFRSYTPQIKAKIYSFDLDADNVLELTEGFINKITDLHTIYGDDKQHTGLEKANEILNNIQQLERECGFNFFYPTSILKTSLVNHYQINVEAFVFQTKQ